MIRFDNLQRANFDQLKTGVCQQFKLYSFVFMFNQTKFALTIPNITMVAYFCHHLSDNYDDLSDLYVDLSDHYVDLSENYHHN